MTKQNIGRLYGIGVGPGDPELLTLRAHRILSTVPVVFVPQKDETSGSVAYAVIAHLVSQDRITRLTFPMRRDEAQLAGYWRQAAGVIWQHLARGEDGALVNLGDPLFYGTFIHVTEEMKKSHPEVVVEVIPGISSINAAAARALVPLGIGDQRLAVISGHDDDETIRETLERFDTVVFIKVHRQMERLRGILAEMGLLGKCVYVSRCTTGQEEIIRDIAKLKGERLDYLSLLLVRR